VVPALGRAADAAETELFEAARRAARHAYAPYSGYAVGAVVVGPSGLAHAGVNVENASYPAGLCAERAALAALVAAGEREVRVAAVAAGGGDDCLPCGLCLQALAEFGDVVVVARSGGAVRAVRLHELLAAPFRLERTGGDSAGAAGDQEAGR
jgi:cytidine deaminase